MLDSRFRARRGRKRISADAILRVSGRRDTVVTHVPEDAALLGSTRGIDADFPGFSGVSD
ncbi:MAG: hypothetical protein ACLR5G_16215 [Eubacteriales bacterium]